MGRTAVCQAAIVVALLSTSLLAACKSDGDADGDGGGGSSGSGGGSTGGSAGSGGTSGSGGAEPIHPPPGCSPGPSQCNPLTNHPCVSGEACDVLIEDGGFLVVCFPPKNTVPVGGACTDNGPYCQPELHCKDDRCARFCCANADCPDGGECTPLHPEKGTLGTCPLPSDGGT